MKKKIKFEKYVDPLHRNIEEVEWPGYDQDEEGEPQKIHGLKQTKVVQTPYGLLTMLDSTFADGNIDFWIMHTNFDITPQVVDTVKRIPGVETLEVGTRYRARVGFPKSGFFSVGEVCEKIKTILNNQDREKDAQQLMGLTTQVAQLVMSTRDRINEKYDNWAIGVLPNGGVEVLVADNKTKNFNNKVAALAKACNLVGGRLLSSGEDYE